MYISGLAIHIFEQDKLVRTIAAGNAFIAIRNCNKDKVSMWA